MVFHEKVESLFEKCSQIVFSRKVDRERMTIGSCLAHRFGPRIFARGDFSKRVWKMLATAFSIFKIFTKFDVFWGRNYEIGV